jgi:DNA-binding response OmpR family regulator
MADVLLIEDDQTQRFVAAYALKKAGHQVQEAADGAQGLEMARSLKPQVIVCDVMMPGINGYQFVTALRQDPAISAIPVILLTAMAERTHMRLGMVSGADDYLPKPFRPQELIEAIEAVMAKRNAHHEAVLVSVQDEFVAALEQQKEALASRYESQLIRELNARWTSDQEAGAEQHFADAVILLADLFGSLRAAPLAEDQRTELTRRAVQGAHDTLYLFGASHVLPYGDDLLAVFSSEQDSKSSMAGPRALRAALGLLKADVGGRSGLSVALHTGPLTLIKVQDTLHGDAGSTVVPGESLDKVSSLRKFAKAAGWRVAASAEMTQRLGPAAETGRRSAFSDDQGASAEAVELLALLDVGTDADGA